MFLTAFLHALVYLVTVSLFCVFRCIVCPVVWFNRIYEGGGWKLPKFVSSYDIWRTKCFWDSMYISLIFVQCLEFGFQIFSKLLNAKSFQCILWRHMGRLGIDPLILNFESRWRRMVQLKLWLLFYNTGWIGSWVVSRLCLEVDEGNLLPCHYSAVVQHVASSLY